MCAPASCDGLNFPLLSDYWPHGAVSESYGVFDDAKGCPQRSSYVIDKAGRIAWLVHNDLHEARDLDEHLRRLHALV